MTAILSTSDFLRAPVQASACPRGFKEWQHFVVHGHGQHFLVNFSLNHEGDGNHLTPRVIVIAHDGKWSGAVERFAQSDLNLAAQLDDVVIGRNRMLVHPNGYRVEIDLPDSGIRGELDFTSVSRPFVVNNQPLGTGRLSWLFVPRLRATGWLRVAERDHYFEEDLAYHDHNWGRFQWGDDFGWTWGTVLPRSADAPWSMVFLQMTDRKRLRCLSKALYVWRNEEPVGLYRHSAVRTSISGTLAGGADCTLPPPMRILLDSDVPGVPELVEVSASSATDTVYAEFRSESYARLAKPSELHLDRSIVLCETSGTVHVHGEIQGEPVDFVGDGVFEFFYG